MATTCCFEAATRGQTAVAALGVRAVPSRARGDSDTDQAGKRTVCEAISDGPMVVNDTTQRQVLQPCSVTTNQLAQTDY